MSSLITLPQPCPASWGAMTPTAAGRHCATCRTEVVDFTQNSPTEILAYLRQAGSQPVCGRVRTAQLAPARAADNRWRRWAGTLLVASTVGALLPGLVAGATLAGAGLAAAPPSAGRPGFQIAPKLPRRLRKQLAASQLVVRGVVLDAGTRTPAAGIIILLKDTNWATSTDADGRFALTVVPKGRHVELVAALPGYKTLVTKLSIEECEAPVTILLRQEIIWLGRISPVTNPRSR